jgi:molybdenum cofactor cytidylyltransferase
MGRAKALLPYGHDRETFVSHLAHTLREGGAEEVIVVGRPDAAELETHVSTLGNRIRFVVNHDPDRGQLSSLVAGIEAAAHADGVLVMPVDIPRVRAATISALITALSTTTAPILRATCEGRHGHPVLFRRAVFPDLRDADPNVGAKAVLQRHAGEVRNVDVDDPGILHDVDRPEDYERLFGRPP